MGRALYPHPQWDTWATLWDSFYPTKDLDQERRVLLANLEATMPAFVSLLVNHRPKALRGKSLAEVMSVGDRQPARLTALYNTWGSSPTLMRSAPPTLAFAVIGQARADGKITAEDESNTLASLLTYWAVRSALNISTTCATQSTRCACQSASTVKPITVN